MLLEKVGFAGDSKCVMDDACTAQVCVCVCERVFFFFVYPRSLSNTHTHTHTDLYICVYVGVYMLCYVTECDPKRTTVIVFDRSRSGVWLLLRSLN